MKILWLSWKDMLNPYSGGAEVVLHEICKRLVADGHEVTILTARYPGSSKYDTIDGTKIIRIGNSPYTHPFLALGFYLRNLRGSFDVVVDVVNTAPYLASVFRGRSMQILFYHQLARKVWFYEARPPLSWLGYYLLEPLATFLLSHVAKSQVVTISQSTRQDLINHGFSAGRITVITQGSTLLPLKDVNTVRKFAQPTVLSLGSMRPMKGTLDQIEAFHHAKLRIPNLKLKVAGGGASGEYGGRVLKMIADSPYATDIEYVGKVDESQKIALMQHCHLLLVSSVKEGWGLVITEAASQGTPAVVYDVDGLRDSVQHRKTGIICETNTPECMASHIVAVLNNPKSYELLRSRAWKSSHRHTFDRCYQDFVQVIS